MTGKQIYMLVILALALAAIVLLAIFTDGQYIVAVISFLGGWMMPAPNGVPRGAGPVLVLLCLYGATIHGCASTGPQLTTTTPMLSITISFDASDGGTIDGSQVWIDRAGQDVKPITTGNEQDITTPTEVNGAVGVGLPGGTGTASQVVSEDEEEPDPDALDEGAEDEEAAP